MHCLEGISASTAAISAVTAVVIAAWFGGALSLASFWRRFARWRRRELQKPTRLLYWDLLPITRGDLHRLFAAEHVEKANGDRRPARNHLIRFFVLLGLFVLTIRLAILISTVP